MNRFEKVQDIIADALYVDKEEVTRDASLMKDLGAESIDFLDIIFRLEKEFGVKIPRGEIERKARGDLSEEDFAINGVLTQQGIARLKQVMPEVDQSVVVKGLKARDIPSLFTPVTFLNMVAEQLDGVEEKVSVPAGAVLTEANA